MSVLAAGHDAIIVDEMCFSRSSGYRDVSKTVNCYYYHDLYITNNVIL